MADGNLKSKFNSFANFGAGASKKTTLTTKNLTKMFKDNKLYGKNLTTTDTDITFSKVKTKGKSEITFEEFVNLLEQLSEKYEKDHKKDKDGYVPIKEAIANGIDPSTAGSTKTSKTGGVDKMTDVSQYTGAHKERFDAETGKGKGASGRSDAVDNTGYVGSYKGSGTYGNKK